MVELIREILNSPAGSFGFIFCLLAVSFFVVWKVSHFTTKFNTVEKLESNIDTIKQDIHIIKAFIEVFRDRNNPLAQRHSPVALTPIGKQVCEELDAEKIILNHWDKFKKDALNQLKEDSNPYDIQVICFKIGDKYQDYVNEKEMDIIKLHAFKAGYDLDTYNLLFGILIRDKILNLNGYTSKDVDKFDPNPKQKT